MSSKFYYAINIMINIFVIKGRYTIKEKCRVGIKILKKIPILANIPIRLKEVGAEFLLILT